MRCENCGNKNGIDPTTRCSCGEDDEAPAWQVIVYKPRGAEDRFFGCSLERKTELLLQADANRWPAIAIRDGGGAW